MKKIEIICLITAVLMIGCTNPLDSYIDKPKNGAPGALLNVSAEAGMGMVTFRWQNPDNYYYTDISYTDLDGNTIKKLASKYSVDETLGEGFSRFVFTGFEVSSNYTFTLVPYSTSGEAGPASIINCTPKDKSEVYRYILETLTVEPALQGAYISWENEWEALVTVTISFNDYSGEAKVVTIKETNQPERIKIGPIVDETELTIIAYNMKGAASEPIKVKVAPLTVSVDSPAIGWFLNKDGSITETKQTEGDKQSYAVIAYVGSVEHYFSHFIAIAFTDCTATGEDGEPVKATLADAFTLVDKYAAHHPITIEGTTFNTGSSASAYDVVERSKDTPSTTRTDDAEIGWRLPCVTDFRYAMQGLTSINSAETQFNATDPVGIAPNGPNNIASGEGTIVANAIMSACKNDLINKLYWISSLDGTKPTTHAWYYRIDMNGWYLLDQTNPAPFTRAVFAY